jgi:hypothetical protein
MNAAPLPARSTGSASPGSGVSATTLSARMLDKLPAPLPRQSRRPFLPHGCFATPFNVWCR